eukprot:312582_1
MIQIMMKNYTTKQFLVSKCLIRINGQQYNLRNTKQRYLMIQHFLFVCQSSTTMCHNLLYQYRNDMYNINQLLASRMCSHIIQHEILHVLNRLGPLFSTVNIHVKVSNSLNTVLFSNWMYLMRKLFYNKCCLLLKYIYHDKQRKIWKSFTLALITTILTYICNLSKFGGESIIYLQSMDIAENFQILHGLLFLSIRCWKSKHFKFAIDNGLYNILAKAWNKHLCFKDMKLKYTKHVSFALFNEMKKRIGKIDDKSGKLLYLNRRALNKALKRINRNITELQYLNGAKSVGVQSLSCSVIRNHMQCDWALCAKLKNEF